MLEVLTEIYTEWARKTRQMHGHYSVKSEPIFKIRSVEDSLVNLQFWLLTIPPHIAHVATLQCEVSVSINCCVLKNEQSKLLLADGTKLEC